MELRTSTAAVGLVLLVLLDAVLITWALWPTSTVAARDMPTSVPGPSAREAVTRDGDEALATLVPTQREVSLAPLVRFVAGLDSATAWLAEGGDCERLGRVHVTLDGGASWTTESTPGSVTRIRSSDASAAFVVGGDAECAARVWYTGDRGETWSPALSVSNAWGRSPDDARVVLRPGSEPVQPCLGGAVLDLAVFSADDAVVLCREDGMRITSDGGASWLTMISGNDLLAISPTPAGGGAAVRLVDNCPGVAVSALEGGRLGAPHCIENASYAPGQVAISVTDGAVWVVAGDDVYRAGDAWGPFVRVSTWPES